MKKLLFITYFWPPSGKATLHWPLKIIKHLPQSGWQPSVLTVENESFTQKDESLLKEVDPSLKVIKSKTFEPFDIYKKFIGKRKDEQLVASDTISLSNKSFSHRLSIWIRMNLFIPDARIGWNSSAKKAGKDFLTKHDQEAIVTIGPPHSTHLIGKKLSKKFNLPHIPVLIDPWVDIIYYKNFKRSYLTRKIDNHLEKSVLDNASQVVFVTESTKEDYTKKYNFLKDKSHVLYWGYNEEDFSSFSNIKDAELKTIVHAGNIFDYQNPINFWNRIRKEIDNGKNIKLKFIGTISSGIKSAIESAGLNSHTEIIGFLPYSQMVKHLESASALLVCATEKRHMPGKLFEYLRTGKPIIAFGDDNKEVNSILQKSNAGMLFKYNSDADEFFKRFSQFNTDLNFVKQFDRKVIAEKFAGILNSFSVE
ncbi:MAG: glycosyltransferase [Ignavibacteriales bacterium]|nr:MAG: glycosyltransferase [Ignavibacteriales bacterium]